MKNGRKVATAKDKNNKDDLIKAVNKVAKSLEGGSNEDQIFIQPMLTRRSRFICRHACCGSGCAEVARVVRLATVCLARNQKHTFIESGWRGVVSIYVDLAHGY